MMTKKEVEKIIGYEITEYIIEPVFDGKKIIGYSLGVVPLIDFRP